MSLTWRKLDSLICLHFPMAATRGVCHFDVDSGDIGTLMWLSDTLMLAFNTLKKKKRYDIIEL